MFLCADSDPTLNIYFLLEIGSNGIIENANEGKSFLCEIKARKLVSLLECYFCSLTFGVSEAFYAVSGI